MSIKQSWVEFLSPENQEKINALKEQLGDNGAWIQFWDERTVQLDGDFTLSDLKVLVQMMESFVPQEHTL